MFRGRFVHTMDAKGRLSIPMGYRTEILRRSDRAPVIMNLENCLALYPYEDWVKVEQELSNLSSLDPEVQKIQRFLISGSDECPIDNQGRILVPAYLREHAALDREITLAGVGPRIEIWDKTRFDEDLESTRGSYNEISKAISKLGL
jgi:MraZ protein